MARSWGVEAVSTASEAEAMASTACMTRAAGSELPPASSGATIWFTATAGRERARTTAVAIAALRTDSASSSVCVQGHV